MQRHYFSLQPLDYIKKMKINTKQYGYWIGKTTKFTTGASK